MNGTLQTRRTSLAAKAALAFLFVAAAIVCAFPAQALGGSKDVHTLYDDGLVYYGGFYDIEFTTDFTPVKYQWRAKLDCGAAGIKKTDVSDFDDPNYWAHGANTNHLHWGTVCDNWREDGSDDNDFGLLRFYCEITDEKGGKHYTDDFMIRVRSLADFKARLESDGGFTISNVTPSPSGGVITNLTMPKGTSQTFRLTQPTLPGWVDASDPAIESRWEVLRGGTNEHSVYTGTSFTFNAEKAGTYLIGGGSNLKLGNTDTGVDSCVYYLVEVVDQYTPDKPEVTTIETLRDPALSFSSYVSDQPSNAALIPSASVSYGGHFSATTIAGKWQVNRGNGWESLGSGSASKYFLFPNRYRYVLDLAPKPGYALPANLPLTVKASMVFSTSSDTVTLNPSVESMPDAVRYVVREIVPRQKAPNPGHMATPEEIIDEITDHGDPADTPMDGWSTDAYGDTYYFVNGTPVTGWKQISGTWYCFESTGVLVKHDWRKWGGKWYYLGDDGAMYVNRWVADGSAWYYVGADGAMYQGKWLSWGGNWYYFGGDGAMLVNRWLNWGGAWYYFLGDGAMAHDQWVGGYHLGSDGRWDN